MFQIENSPMPAPAELRVRAYETLSVTRTADGTAVRGPGARKRELSLKWPKLDGAAAARVMDAVSRPAFTLRYTDPQDGDVTRTFFCDEQAVGMYSSGRGAVWTELTAVLREV